MAKVLPGKGQKTIPGIYFIRNNFNRRVYVGSAVNVQRRKIEHKKLLKAENHPNRFLQNDFKKHQGSFNEIFTFEVKEHVLDKNSLLKREQYYLDRLYDSQDICYNLAPVANSALGVKWSETSKKLHSDKRVGKGNPMWGKQHHIKTRLLMATKQQKRVEQFTSDGTLIAKHDSISGAAAAVGLTRQMIGHCCNGNRKSGKGFIWRFEK